MIVKFDHISLVIEPSDYLKKDKFLIGFGYKLKFFEKEKINMPIKDKYFKHKQNTHDLYYYEHHSKLPIEVIVYSFVTNNNSPFSYDIQNNRFQVNINTIEFFNILFKKDSIDKTNNKIINIKGILDKKDILLQANSSNADFFWNLDNKGFCCPTFIVSNLVSYKKYLESKGLYCSDINNIEVNEIDLHVFFVEGKNNELVEIISYNL